MTINGQDLSHARSTSTQHGRKLHSEIICEPECPLTSTQVSFWKLPPWPPTYMKPVLLERLEKEEIML